MISAEVAPVDSAEMLISDTSVEDACDAATIPTACNAETGVNGHCHRVDSEDGMTLYYEKKFNPVLHTNDLLCF